MKAQVVQAEDIVSNSVIFFDKVRVHDRDVRQMFKTCREGNPDVTNVWAIPVDDVDEPLMTIASEEQMNAAGWYRK